MRLISHALRCLLFASWFFSTLAAAPVSVRYVEGVAHGFLTVRESTGKIIASGDLLQTSKRDRVESRMILSFKDGSSSDETVTFTELHAFEMQAYRLLQKGPSFDEDRDVSIDRTGKYRVKTKDHKNGREKVLDGTVQLPADVYNGMAIVVARNLPKGAAETVHYIAFTPKPRVIELQLIPGPVEKVHVGDAEVEATDYTFRPQLGALLGIVAKVTGRTPPDYHTWITSGELPTFLRTDGPLYIGGPIWRLELAAPRWP